MLNIKSYNQAAYEAIKEKIISKEFEPGKILNERQLSKDFGISRTPIREALMKLSFEGWIINEPYKPTHVREFDLDSILEAQKVRSALEILAVKEASKRINEKDIKVLEDLLLEQQKVDDYNSLIKLDRSFHEYIYKLSNNFLLIGLMKNINDIVRYFGLIAMKDPGRTEVVFKEHREIIEGLKKRDIEKSKKAMSRHMFMTEKSIIRRFEDK